MTPGSFIIILFGLVNTGILLLALGIYLKIKALQDELEENLFHVRKKGIY
jgi:hypothetical protein